MDVDVDAAAALVQLEHEAEKGATGAEAMVEDEEEEELTEAEQAVGVDVVERVGTILDRWERRHVHVSHYGNHSGRGAALKPREYVDLRNTRDGARLFNWKTVAVLLQHPELLTVQRYYESINGGGDGAPRLTRNTGGVSSYALKHVVESLLGQYVANGDLIIARALLDMPMQFTLNGERLVNPLCF